MSSVHLSLEGFEQALMLTAIAVGSVIAIDSVLFMMEEPSLSGRFNVDVLLNDKIRGAAQLAIGVMLVMFGAGKWTVQIGWIAIASMVAMTSGVLWKYSGERGQANQHYTTVATQHSRPVVQQASIASRSNAKPTQRWVCPLVGDKLDWCDEDHNADGTPNRYDKAFNKNSAGIRNCAQKNYITNRKENEDCKPLKP